MAEISGDLFTAMRQALRPGRPPGALSGFTADGPNSGFDFLGDGDGGAAADALEAIDAVDASAEETARVRALIDERRSALRAASAPASAEESAKKFTGLDVQAACALSGANRAADALAAAASRVAELAAVQALNVGRILADEDPPTFPPAPRGAAPEVALRGRMMVLAGRLTAAVAEFDKLAASAARHANELGAAARATALASAAALDALEAAGVLATAPAPVPAPAPAPDAAAAPPDVFAAAAAAIAARQRTEIEPASQ